MTSFCLNSAKINVFINTAIQKNLNKLRQLPFELTLEMVNSYDKLGNTALYYVAK